VIGQYRRKLVLSQNCLICDLLPSVLNFYSNGKSLKLSFTLNRVLNDFKLTRFAFEVPQKFEAVLSE